MDEAGLSSLVFALSDVSLCYLAFQHGEHPFGRLANPLTTLEDCIFE